MASNYTTNFGLCQWEAADQVQRTDFNQDNAKIEAAILGRLGPIEIILQKTLTEQASYVLLDVSDVDWNQWSIAAVCTSVRISNTSEGQSSQFSVEGPSVSGNVFGSLCQRRPGPMMALLFPGRDASRKVCVLSFPGGDIACGNKLVSTDLTTYESITGFRFSISNPLKYPAGGVFTVFGIR